jgi:hypothetical protein
VSEVAQLMSQQTDSLLAIPDRPQRRAQSEDGARAKTNVRHRRVRLHVDDNQLRRRCLHSVRNLEEQLPELGCVGPVEQDVALTEAQRTGNTATAVTATMRPSPTSSGL